MRAGVTAAIKSLAASLLAFQLLSSFILSLSCTLLAMLLSIDLQHVSL